MTPEAEIIALRRRVRELEEELAEYERRGDDPLGERAETYRLHQVRSRLGAAAVPRLRWACLLLAFLRAPGRVLGKETLLQHLCGDLDRSVRNVDVAIFDARHALKRHSLKIETVWGVGYRMDPSDCHTLRTLLGELAHD